MNNNFIISCESTVDMPYSYISGRGIPVLFYSYSVDGVEYEDDMCRTENGTEKFFSMISKGALPTTSQINLYKYLDFFEELLKTNDNILHIAFGSGMTPSVVNALEASRQLNEKYSDKKIVVVDSLCSCTGYGLIVDTAADMRDLGSSLETVEKWLLENRNRVHHQFFNTDMTFFRRSGRVSGVTATVASILGICPIMHLNDEGKIIAYSKARGKKATIEYTAKEVASHIENPENYNGKFYISHSNCLEDAKLVEAELIRVLPCLNGKIKLFEIGNIISCHCGPGTVAVFFMGDERAHD